MMKFMKKLIFLIFLFPLFKASCVPPDEALKRLIDGNIRYKNNKLIHPNRGFEVRQKQVEIQDPFAIILGCSDSRVPPEIIFDQGLGDLFIVRVAGNILGNTELESLKFSIKYLNSSLVVVLGHQNCGAIKAVISGKSEEFESISKYLKPVCDQAKGSASLATLLNVKQTVRKLKESPYLMNIIQDKKIQIVGAVYDLETGSVTIIEQD